MMRAARYLSRQLVGRAAELGEELLELAATTACAHLDGYAFWWLGNRSGLDRTQATELLERLGARVGAKIEYDVPP